MKEPCPSCDLGLSSPNQPGHVCYTYAEQARRVIEARRGTEAREPEVLLWEGDQA